MVKKRVVIYPRKKSKNPVEFKITLTGVKDKKENLVSSTARNR